MAAVSAVWLVHLLADSRVALMAGSMGTPSVVVKVVCWVDL